MKLFEVISRVDTARPNAVPISEKTAWLQSLDRTVNEEIIERHGAEALLPVIYTPDSPPDTELLIPSPWDEAYLYYLEARIAYDEGEITRYNNANAMYLSTYDAFARSYNRKNQPERRSFCFFSGGAV